MTNSTNKNFFYITVYNEMTGVFGILLKASNTKLN